MRVNKLALTVLLAASPLAALAHGPQLQLTRQENIGQNDQIVTREIFNNEPYVPLSDPKRVYVMPLIETQGVWYSRPNNELSTTVPGLPEYLSGPGIAFGYDQVDGGPRDFASGFRFELKLIDGLQVWDGSAFVDPGDEQIEAYRSSGSAITNDSLSSASPATMPYGNVSGTYNSTAHSGASLRLLGNGTDPLSESQDGVYLLSMQYASTEPGLDASAPFYFLLHKNASPAAVTGALGDLLSTANIDGSLVQFVPEPSSAMLLALSVVAGASWRRNRCRV